MRRAVCAIGIPALVISLAACDATTELTRAPFNATTDISDGITNATSDITRPTQEFTSSTTPGALDLLGPAKARKQLEAFAAYSYDNVRADIARGEGEYLTSLATLAGVPADSYTTFGRQMQGRYATLYEGESRREVWTRVVNTAWSAGYGREGREE